MAESSEPTPLPPASGQKPAPNQREWAANVYRQGELAFKQGQYPVALERFQQLVDSPDTDPPLRLKGEMGLILAQHKLGQRDQARQGCQRVMASGIPEARRWAASILAKWPDSQISDSQVSDSPTTAPSLSPTDSPFPRPPSAGFVPVDSPAAGTSPAAPHGLQPTSTASSDLTGFQPLAPDSTPSVSLGVSQPQNLDIAEPATTASLFHYQYLNQGAREIAPEEVEPTVAAVSPEIGSGAPDHQFAVDSTPKPSPQRPVAQDPRQRQPERPLPRPYDLWIAQIITLLVVLWVAITGLHWVLRSINALLHQVTWPIRLGGWVWRDQAYTIPVMALVLGFILASPWWMDMLLAQGYGQRPLTPRQLQSKHPEALKRLRQQCQKQGWNLPELRILPDPVPLCFSYGWQPRYLRIAVSQGLIDNGDDDILGIFLTYELAHMANWATAMISGLGGLLLLLHTVYRILSQWADGQSSAFFRITLGLVAQGIYGLFWSLRRGLLWVSRLRSRWADRQLEALIQRPDLQHTSLIWLTQQLPAHLNQRKPLSPLWWSLDVLMPLSPQAAISPGSFIPALGEAITVLSDWANPYRQWIVGGSSHQPLGDRLRWLHQRATQRQQPTLNPDPITALPLPFSLSRLLRQKSPMVGLLLGSGLALGFWFVGGLVMRFGWQRLSWWYQDESLLYGGVLLGLGIGLLLRINALYPDIAANQPIVDDPSFLLGSPDQLPVEGEPCRLSGTLLGPLGMAQGVGQHLYLATLGGIVKVGVSSPQLGLQTLRQGSFPLKPWAGRSVTVSGWRRRSDGVVWVDLETIRLTSQQRGITVSTPLWNTLMSLGLCLWGVFILWTGG